MAALQLQNKKYTEPRAPKSVTNINAIDNNSVVKKKSLLYSLRNMYIYIAISNLHTVIIRRGNIRDIISRPGSG